jgi:hypothetical protein
MSVKCQKDNDLTSLPNIGKVTAKKLNKIGIYTAEDFLKCNPYEVFTELLNKVDPTLCRCALASLVGAKLGCSWHKITKESAHQYEALHPSHKWPKC